MLEDTAALHQFPLEKIYFHETVLSRDVHLVIKIIVIYPTFPYRLNVIQSKRTMCLHFLNAFELR